MLTSISSVPMTGPIRVPRPPRATQITSSVPNTKPAYSGATTICTLAKAYPAIDATTAEAASSKVLTRETLRPRYSQRGSFSRMATSTRPASLLTNSHVPAVTATRYTPEIQNHPLRSSWKLSKPESPLLDPVKVPPE